MKGAFTAGLQESKAPPAQKQTKDKKKGETAPITLGATILLFIRNNLVHFFAKSTDLNRSKLQSFLVINLLQRRFPRSNM